MNAIIEFTHHFFNKLLGNQAEQDGVHAFNGGVHPPQHKTESSETPIATLAMPPKLTLPLRQHIGNLPKLRVKAGDHVLKGELLAEPEGNVSAAIHAPTSGEIIEISEQVIAHPSGLKDHCIILRPDGKDEWTKKEPVDWRNLDKHLLVNHLRESGIVGLGGATFPSHIKLRTDGSSNIHTLVINAAECEPYITCDDRLMREQAEAIAKGIETVKWMLGAEQCIIGIEDNKPEAETAMQAFTEQYGYTVKRVPTLYPSGDARRLVHLLTGQEVPHNQRSTDIGVQVFNVATVLAIHRYFDFGEPAISRIVTMTGAVKTPQNFEVLFGTPLSELVSAAGGAQHNTSHFVMGGPMMGFNLPLEDVPVAKASNCFIAVTPELFEAPPPAMPCIRCARCADACPVSLQPQELYWFSKSDQFEKARDYQLFDCIECGCCSYVCPSNIPLVQYYRYAKSEVITADKAKEAADLARERNEFRLARIEREKAERAQKHAERAQAAKAKKSAEAKKAAEQAAPAIDADKVMKQEAIAAAVARAKAKKEADAQAGIKPQNTENISPAVAAKIEAIDTARNQAKANVDANTDAEKQAKIQAAIEKAKALKANKQQSQPANASNDDADKQAKIQAAIAKAKAAKGNADSTERKAAPTPQSNAEDEKQAKIAAAIAKAKANKAAADQVKETDTADEVNKQAKIEAAIAKAKAKKATADANNAEASTQQTMQTAAPAANPETDKQARIQAALARARANKQSADAAQGISPQAAPDPATAAPIPQQASTATNNDGAVDEKQAKINAALEKARANKRKADAAKGIAPKPPANETQAPPTSTSTPSESATNSAEGQSDKVKAALARARANKQAADATKGTSPQTAPTQSAESTPSQTSKTVASDAVVDEKQAKINAALERARANKRKADAAKAAKQHTDDDA